MRRASLIAALLILSLANSASACVIAPSRTPASCHRTRLTNPCAPKTLHIANPACDPVLKSAPAQCSLRGLLQFHFLLLRTFDIAAPLLHIAKKSSPPPATLKLTSIGSPETDRGPPRS